MTTKRVEAELIARGKALPEDCRLMYVSQPSPTERSRWAFQGGHLALGEAEARAFIVDHEPRAATRDA